MYNMFVAEILSQCSMYHTVETLCLYFRLDAEYVYSSVSVRHVSQISVKPMTLLQCLLLFFSYFLQKVCMCYVAVFC